MKRKNPVAAEIAVTRVMIVNAAIPVTTDAIRAVAAQAVPAVRSREDSASQTNQFDNSKRRKTLPGITLSRVIFFVPDCNICGKAAKSPPLSG